MSEFSQAAPPSPRIVYPLIALLLLLFLLCYSLLIPRALKGPAGAEQQQPLPAASYPELLQRYPNPLLYVDLGRDNRLLSWRGGKGAISIALKDIVIGHHWQLGERERARGHSAWHARVQENGIIIFRFLDDELRLLSQKQRFNAAFYFVDDLSAKRNARVLSGKKQYVVDRMFPGRWVYIPLAKDEVANGTARVAIRVLTGYGTLISAIAIVAEQP